MPTQIAQIAALYHERKKKLGLVNARALDVREQYNGDVVIPLPELDRNEKNAVANLLAQGLDQMAMRSASTEPDPFFAPIRPGFDKHETAAVDRRKAILGWWDMNRMTIKDQRIYRHFYGYGRQATVIVPDFKRGVPTWQLRDPLMTYPAPCADLDELTPSDCIFTYHQSGRWLKANYNDAWNVISRRRGHAENPDELFEVIEYMDDEEFVLGVLGTKQSYYDSTINGMEMVELVRTPNKAGRCPAVIAGRVTLDRPGGMYDGMLGMYQQQSMLQALSVIATKKGIFKDEWLIARPGEIPKIVRMADGLSGQIGILQGGDIKEMSLDPSYMAPQMIKDLEQAQRMEAGIPAQFTGNGPTNSRTGRASDSILAETVNYTIQSAQKILAYARQEQDKIAIAVDKGYWNTPKSFYVPWNGESERLDYTPQELWESDEHRVEYSHAGVDENGRTIEVGQLIGMGLISKEAARRMHPLIKDAELMETQSTNEALTEAVKAALQQQAQQPGANLADYVKIAQYVTQKGMDLLDAVVKVHEEAQQRQAQQTPEGAPDVVPPGSPQAQPGLAAPGQGAEAAAAIQPPPLSMQDLQQNLMTLRRPVPAPGV
jgi:hypothetical protein